MDLDEVDLAIIELFGFAADVGVSPWQTARMLRERINLAYLIESELEDTRADDPMPSPSVH